MMTRCVHLRNSCYQLFWSSTLEQPSGKSRGLCTIYVFKRYLKTFLFTN